MLYHSEIISKYTSLISKWVTAAEEEVYIFLKINFNEYFVPFEFFCYNRNIYLCYCVWK